MDPLIITVTVDSTMSYPGNPLMPPIEDLEKVASEYVDAVKSGATIVHHHGIHHLEKEIQPDGRRLSKIDFAGWRKLTELIRDKCDPIVQFGIASCRLEEKIRLMDLEPEMMSYAFNVHDEFFQPDPKFPANEMYAIHPRDELATFARAALEHGVKPEVECFYTGAYWNLEFIRQQGLLEAPIWTTLFLGWAGGAWTPPTFDALLYMVSHLPTGCNWNLSVMNPEMQWKLHAMAIAMGGHVRVGWEDNPYLPDGSLARSNSELVDVVARIAKQVGRPVATPDEARRVTGVRVRELR